MRKKMKGKKKIDKRIGLYIICILWKCLYKMPLVSFFFTMNMQ